MSDKMSPKVRQAEIDKRAAKPYTFTLGDDEQEYQLQPLDTVDGGVIRATKNMNDFDAALHILEHVADEAALAAIDELRRPEFLAFIDRWQKWQQVSSGESSASSS